MEGIVITTAVNVKVSDDRSLVADVASAKA
jgi:hypothetical protein